MVVPGSCRAPEIPRSLADPLDNTILPWKGPRELTEISLDSGAAQPDQPGEDSGFRSTYLRGALEYSEIPLAIQKEHPASLTSLQAEE